MILHQMHNIQTHHTHTIWGIHDFSAWIYIHVDRTEGEWNDCIIMALRQCTKYIYMMSVCSLHSSDSPEEGRESGREGERKGGREGGRKEGREE